jgi:cysteinyl-tRNA synthetase
MKIYDSLTQNIKQLDDDCVSIYNCGPTVYNDIHIGNARPSITFDVLHRLLILLNKKVQYLHNITDIDDKIIKKANELNTTETEISEKYYHAYLDILKQLNIKLMSMPKVSDNIDGIIDYVDRLVKTGVGYVTQDGDVYFSVRKIPAYGELSHQNIQQLLNGVRNETKENKKDPLDFAL